MPDSRTASRLTHQQITSVTEGTGKDRVCPLCQGKLNLYGDDKFLCCNPQQCDKKVVAAELYKLRDAKKVRPSHTPDWTGLTLKQYCEAKRLPAAWVALNYMAVLLHNETPMERTYQGKHVNRTVVEFAYMDVNRKVLFTRFRESMTSKVFSEAGSTMSIPYGLWLWTNKPHEDGKYPRAVVVCEGESDQQTLTYHGVPAIGVPGVNNWKPEWANLPLLKYAEKIFVIQEPPGEGKPDVGKKFVETVAASFPPGKVTALRLSDAKDPSDLHINVEISREFNPKASFMDEFVASVRSVMVESRQIQSVLASEVEMELTRWLWYDHIPVGDITVFAGMPQKGKSTAAIDVVARLTNGKDFPGSVKQVDACEVAILASEDNPKTTTVPRLRAAGADVDRVHLIQGTSDGKHEWEIALGDDLDMLREFLRKHPAIKLIVMDPVTSYIGDVDPNKPKEVRPFLNKLKKFAEEMGVSLLLIMHLSKNPDVSALHRVGGAATWIEVPRSVWFFDVKQQEDDSTDPPSYVMVNGKLNIVADERKKSLGYTFAGVDVEIQDHMQNMGTIRWGEESNVTLEQQYARSKGKTGPAAQKMPAAKRWLEKYLEDGPRKAADLEKDGIAAGHAKWTLKDAKKELNIKTYPVDGVYMSALPARDVLGEVVGS